MSNMMYVYMLPERLSDGYCFAGGKPIEFMNVDWFSCDVGLPRTSIENHIRASRYYRPDRVFLALCPDGESFTVTGSANQTDGGEHDG